MKWRVGKYLDIKFAEEEKKKKKQCSNVQNMHMKSTWGHSTWPDTTPCLESVHADEASLQCNIRYK